jgi:hypothetical protein
MRKDWRKSSRITNAYYHTAPRLDITNVSEGEIGKHHLLISSDIFGHIPVFALASAYRNSRRLFQEDGVFIFTVPFTKAGEPRNIFRIEQILLGQEFSSPVAVRQAVRATAREPTPWILAYLRIIGAPTRWLARECKASARYPTNRQRRTSRHPSAMETRTAFVQGF